ncbi:hypothetical protein [Ponticoccus alexandrii]|uniref:Transposase IS66 C-terminal domain-containing protein n=1 Tax=Ponticoccus alexandrii TaxID=1943633 RepID=A0ABX7FEV0_9RHOB|nr:hypothetical protein [Ponticoccus alexandrii]QRF69004.1 hypothetical protein GQA70_21805 [Ponticoccus alexandrii]
MIFAVAIKEPMRTQVGTFSGHEVGAESWAMLASLIANCKMSDVDPVSYITETLRALLDSRPKRRIENAHVPALRDRARPRSIGRHQSA